MSFYFRLRLPHPAFTFYGRTQLYQSLRQFPKAKWKGVQFLPCRHPRGLSRHFGNRPCNCCCRSFHQYHKPGRIPQYRYSLLPVPHLMRPLPHRVTQSKSQCLRVSPSPSPDAFVQFNTVVVLFFGGSTIDPIKYRRINGNRI